MVERKINVLVVEDSPTAQSLLKGIIAADPFLILAGIAVNGNQAVEFVKRNKPDVISMDINMPVMDGLQATRLIMEQFPVPIVIVSSQYEPSDVALSMQILEAGALTILPRPSGPASPDFQQSARHYQHTLKMMAGIKLKPKASSYFPSIERVTDNASFNLKSGLKDKGFPEIVLIGASAGGPAAIESILKGLPDTFPIPILIVQHIDPNFAGGFCEWLGQITRLQVHIAKHGEKALPGHVYLPPGDTHLGMLQYGIISVIKDPVEKNLRPAVSYLFRTAGEIYKKNILAILLSGMGTDGAAELKKLRENGATTIVQDMQSALVFGMPGEAVKLNAADLILPPNEILQKLLNLIKE